MGLSINTFVYEGTNTFDLNFALGFNSRDDISAYIIRDDQEVDVPFNWVSDNRVSLSQGHIVNNGETLYFARNTDLRAPAVDLTVPGNITPENIQATYENALYGVHMVLDGRIGDFHGALYDRLQVEETAIEGVLDRAEEVLSDVNDAQSGARSAALAAAQARDTAQANAASASAIVGGAEDDLREILTGLVSEGEDSISNYSTTAQNAAAAASASADAAADSVTAADGHADRAESATLGAQSERRRAEAANVLANTARDQAQVHAANAATATTNAQSFATASLNTSTTAREAATDAQEAAARAEAAVDTVLDSNNIETSVIDGRIETWAQRGSAGNIPASKLVNAAIPATKNFTIFSNDVNADTATLAAGQMAIVAGGGRNLTLIFRYSTDTEFRQALETLKPGTVVSIDASTFYRLSIVVGDNVSTNATTRRIGINGNYFNAQNYPRASLRAGSVCTVTFKGGASAVEEWARVGSDAEIPASKVAGITTSVNQLISPWAQASSNAPIPTSKLVNAPVQTVSWARPGNADIIPTDKLPAVVDNTADWAKPGNDDPIPQDKLSAAFLQDPLRLNYSDTSDVAPGEFHIAAEAGTPNVTITVNPVSAYQRTILRGWGDRGNTFQIRSEPEAGSVDMTVYVRTSPISRGIFTLTCTVYAGNVSSFVDGTTYRFNFYGGADAIQPWALKGDTSIIPSSKVDLSSIQTEVSSDTSPVLGGNLELGQYNLTVNGLPALSITNNGSEVSRGRLDFNTEFSGRGGLLRIVPANSGSGIANLDLNVSAWGSGTVNINDGVLNGPNCAINLNNDADGDIYYRRSGRLQRLARGAAGQMLVMGTNNAPEWKTVEMNQAEINLFSNITNRLGLYQLNTWYTLEDAAFIRVGTATGFGSIRLEVREDENSTQFTLDYDEVNRITNGRRKLEVQASVPSGYQYRVVSTNTPEVWVEQN